MVIGKGLYGSLVTRRPGLTPCNGVMTGNDTSRMYETSSELLRTTIRLVAGILKDHKLASYQRL